MEVILIEKIEKLGDVGDLVNVKNGYARNYLIPQEKALTASKENKEYFEQQKKEILAKNEEIRKEAEKTFKKIAGKSAVIIRQASDEGKLFGSVAPKDIAERISEITGTEIKKSQVHLIDAIREIGIFPAKIRIHADFLAEIEVNVARSEEEAKANVKAAKEASKEEEVAQQAAPEVKEEAVSAEEAAIEAAGTEETPAE